MGLIGGLAFSGCTQRTRPWRRSQTIPTFAPLPSLEGKPRKEQLAILNEAAIACFSYPMTELYWRRLARIEARLGERKLAVWALDKALRLDTDGQDRSTIADLYLAVGEKQKALASLEGMPYLGKDQRLTKTFDAKEIVATVDRVAATNNTAISEGMIGLLVKNGALDLANQALQKHFRWTLARGPHGGREVLYQNAVLALFRVGQTQSALDYCRKMTPAWQVRTLCGALTGSPQGAEGTLSGDEADLYWYHHMAEPDRQRILQALRQVIHDSPILAQNTPVLERDFYRFRDTQLADLAALLIRLGRPALATEFVQKGKCTDFRREALRAIQQNQEPGFQPISCYETIDDRRAALGARLDRIMGIRLPQRRRQLLKQVLEELRRSGLNPALQERITAMGAQIDDEDLLLQLMALTTDPTFRLGCQIRQVRMVLERNDVARARALLTDAVPKLSGTMRPNQRARMSLELARLAFLLEDKERLQECIARTLEVEGKLASDLVRADILARLAALEYRRGNTAEYTRLCQRIVDLTERLDGRISEYTSILMGLAREQVQAGDLLGGARTIDRIRLPSARADSLLTALEEGLDLVALPPYRGVALTTTSAAATGRTMGVALTGRNMPGNNVGLPPP